MAKSQKQLPDLSISIEQAAAEVVAGRILNVDDPALALSSNYGRSFEEIKKLLEDAVTKGNAELATKAKELADRQAAEAEAARQASESGRVLVIVPQSFSLVAPDGTHLIQAGTRSIPEAWLEHWYVKANGVKRAGE